MLKVPALLFLIGVTLVTGQRPYYAGSRAIGIPEITTTTEKLENRFSGNDVTTPRLPVEANGDRSLVDRLRKLPLESQPFWLLNQQALDFHRQNPQTYPQRTNNYIDPPLMDYNYNPGNAYPTNQNNNFNSRNNNFNSGFESSNRFGVDKYPVQDNRHTFTGNPLYFGNRNTNSGNEKFSAGIGNQNNRPYENALYYSRPSYYQ